MRTPATETSITKIRYGLTVCVLVAVCTTVSGLGSVQAHPADRLKQHLIVGLGADQVRVTLAIGGGILANDLVLDDLDPNRDGRVTEAERQAWIALLTDDLRVTLGGTDLSLDPGRVETTIPSLSEFHVGVAPLIVSFLIPIVDGQRDERHLVVRNDYHLDRTDAFLDVQANPGVALIDRSWPGRTVRIAFAVDPAASGTAAKPDAATAEAWGTGGVIAEAREILNRPKSPGVLALFLGVFVTMGALHAIQPGHGKTLVAAYLVATEGTPRDAFYLAGVVTFTHTISVFVLGLATLAASQIFLPSRVIPVMGVLSGILVAGMGISMVRRARRGVREVGSVGSATSSALPASSDRIMAHSVAEHRQAFRFASHRPSHPHHDHAGLTEEEHARLHLEEALAARRSSVDRRGLLGLGVAGGLAPCPDALAIILLAVGMNQTGFGMVAIVAFSLGLAGVLVAMGLAISMFGPAWQRTRRAAQERGELGGWWHAVFGRLVAASPLVSAVVVLLLGLAMIWSAGASV